MRRCLDCPRIITEGSRCPQHERARERERGTRQQRGYDADWLKVRIELTAASLREYGERYPHWAIAYSGGKDSTATVTLAIYLIESGRENGAVQDILL